MIHVLDFSPEHIEAAGRIALQEYRRARALLPALPPVDAAPDLTAFAENGLGVAALEGGGLLGFLCAYPPFENAFGSTDATGVFAPMGAHGVAGGDRGRVYAALYEGAAAKWARAGASSHAICVYAHDRETQAQFFRNGFGLRCVDAIRGLDRPAFPAPQCADLRFAELPPHETARVLPLSHRLDAHMAASPCFIRRPSETEAAFLKGARDHAARFFAAETNGEIIAFLRIQRGGETFICAAADYLHITGAYCLPEHRHSGVVRELLRLAIDALGAEGYARLGVDFESINPAAWHFWHKDFAAYTYGLARRIDEWAL